MAHRLRTRGLPSIPCCPWAESQTYYRRNSRNLLTVLEARTSQIKRKPIGFPSEGSLPGFQTTTFFPSLQGGKRARERAMRVSLPFYNLRMEVAPHDLI